jgi:hypothetical protein
MSEQPAKQEFLDSLIKESYKAIWVAEITMLRDQELLAKANAHADLIPKKMEEKEYPTAGDGRRDLKDTQDEISRLEREIGTAEAQIGKQKLDIELIERYRSSKRET